jgi:membrane-associated phospholipid phosphatase
MPWFMYLEKTTDKLHYYVMEAKIDKFIPFNEYFIIPYMLWFFLVAGVVLYFLFKDKEAFYRTTAFLFIGMTICLFICTIFPNGQHLRPVVFQRNNVFVDMVKQLYASDTPTNVFPSIHVFNSIGISIGVAHSECFKTKPITRYFVYALSFLIILSTMFLKQHSFLDVIGALVLSVFMYALIYGIMFAGNKRTVGKVVD